MPYQAVGAAAKGRNYTESPGTCRATTQLCLFVLQFRPSLELKEVLLHEMIHAWMFLQKIKDTGDHGARFQERMNFINRATFQDHQARLACKKQQS